MGLIKESSISDWAEYVYCDIMDESILIKRGVVKGNNITTDKIIVDENQFLIVISDGKIVEFTAEPGQYILNKDSNPLLLNGIYAETLINSFKKHGQVSTYENGIYFINMKGIKNNRFGTITPIPFRDSNFGITIGLRCYGEYTMQITDPILFFNTYGIDISDEYVADDHFKDKFLVDFLNVLPSALSKVSFKNIAYNMLPGAVNEISNAVKECLSETWGRQGINVSRVSIASATPTEESVKAISNFDDDKENIMNNAIEKIRDEVNASNDALTQIESITKVEPNELNIEPELDNNVMCPNCGAIITDNFCTMCGTKKPEDNTQNACPKCGKIIDASAKFCTYCGEKL